MLACELLGVMSKAVWAIRVDEINKNIVSKKINVQPKIEPPDISIQNDIIK